MEIVLTGQDFLQKFKEIPTYEQLCLYFAKTYLLKKQGSANQSDINLDEFRFVFLHKEEEEEFTEITSKTDYEIIIEIMKSKQKELGILTAHKIYDLRKQNPDIKEDDEEEDDGEQQEEAPDEENADLKVDSFIGQEKEKKKSKKKNNSTKQLRSLINLITEKIGCIVEQKISNAIPCIANRVEIQLKGIKGMQKSDEVIHEGVKCEGCGLGAIQGVRFSCPECQLFNLCEVCQQKIDHPHFLLKMKKPRDEKQKDKTNKEITKNLKKIYQSMNKKTKHSHCGRPHHPPPPPPFDPQVQNRMHPNPFYPPPPPPHHHHHHPHEEQHYHSHTHSNSHSHSRSKSPGHFSRNHHKKRNEESLEQDFSKTRFFHKLQTKLMNRFGVDADSCTDFIKANYQLGKDEFMTKYMEQNNIELDQGQIRKKVRKLELYLQNYKLPESLNLQELVRANSKKSILMLLKAIKEKYPQLGIDPNNEDALFTMKRRFKRQNKEIESWIQESKLFEVKEPEEKVEKRQDSEIQESDFSKVSEIKSEGRKESIDFSYDLPNYDMKEIRQRGKILIEMKEIFGQDRSSELFKFIEVHFLLGREKIIQKFLEEEYDKSPKKSRIVKN